MRLTAAFVGALDLEALPAAAHGVGLEELVGWGQGGRGKVGILRDGEGQAADVGIAGEATHDSSCSQGALMQL